jgi:hypothetical protein
LDQQVLTYPAIWLTDEKVESDALLAEFKSVLGNKMRIVYPENEDWTGVVAMAAGAANFLDQLPVLNAFLKRFGADAVIGATYFNMKPKSTLHRHRDMNGNLLFGVIRLHIPLQTNPNAFLEMQKTMYHMPLDTLWAMDTSGLHAVQNLGMENRIHLVIDVRRTPLTAKFFPRMSMSVAVHLATFIGIASVKILRDVLSNPKSVIRRVQSVVTRIKGK